jgi:hypothetical protein
MPNEFFTVRRNRGPALTSRVCRSPAIWFDCPWEQVVTGEVDGIALFDDFHRQPVTVPTSEAAYGPDYRGFTSTGGTLNAATQKRGGTTELGSDGDDEGASIQTLGCPFKIIQGDGPLWFEARVKVNTVAVTQYDAFIGLMEKVTLTAAVPITATAGAMADKNFVGFLRPGTGTTGDGSSLKIVYKADGVTAVVLETIAGALVADTYIHLGFKFSPKSFPGFNGDNYLRFFVDNLERTAAAYAIPSAAGTDFPNDVLLGRTAGVTNTAAVTSLFSIDAWRACQLGATA